MQVRGDSTTVLQSVLMCDTERTALLQDEAALVAAAEAATPAELPNGNAGSDAGADAVSSSESTLASSDGPGRREPDAATRLTQVRLVCV